MRAYTILIPHYKTKITAYCLHQIFKHSGNRVNVVVISNSGNEGLNYLEPYADRITTIIYPLNRMQSHGLAFDYAIENGLVKTDYFITLESDSYPTNDNWLEYYDRLIDEGYDMAASRLKLSGGEYYHPAGAMYRLDSWHQCKEYVEKLNDEYRYYPNYLPKDGFNCHIMESAHVAPKGNIEQLNNYLPIAQSVFHNGMGYNQESYHTYGNRNTITGVDDFLKVHNDPIIYRMGYEPGQFFGYWHLATGKKVYSIPTEVTWMHNRVNQQQECTKTENGIIHIWGGTAMTLTSDASVEDITRRKTELTEQLYNSIQNETN